MKATHDDASGTGDSFYLPAVTPDPDFERFGEYVADLLDFHGVVLIPDSYNE